MFALFSFSSFLFVHTYLAIHTHLAISVVLFVWCHHCTYCRNIFTIINLCVKLCKEQLS